MQWITTHNDGGCVALDKIPVISYLEFYCGACEKLAAADCHVAACFGVPQKDGVRVFCLLADDGRGAVDITSYLYGYYDDVALPSVTARRPEMHPFERAIAEKFGIRFDGTPWDKPLRYPFDRFDKRGGIDDYPFYGISGDTLHEVNVGPIHAGIIEPGAFRFICNGEKVLHLEISLGYQHRGIEHLMISTPNRLRQTVLAESIAGDTAVGHSTAYATAIEKLYAAPFSHRRLAAERAVALELKRIAMHVADTGALCMDIGYQLGQVASEALRTIVINTTQGWCGNRFGKGLVRLSGTRYPLTPAVGNIIRENLAKVVRRYGEVRKDLKSAPSVLSRFEDCGNVTPEQMTAIEAVGMAARSCGVERDVRMTHPYGPWSSFEDFRPETKVQGDVMARLMLCGSEIFAAARYINELIDRIGEMPEPSPGPDHDRPLQPGALSYSLVEGWRGEICHVAVTDPSGKLMAYNVKDPSVHNWLALALAVRGEGISDFPINNKSFNLSYCGHDL